jgi:hypothetical protein
MSRRNNDTAGRAAEQASEAARVLQARGQEKVAEARQQDEKPADRTMPLEKEREYKAKPKPNDEAREQIISSRPGYKEEAEKNKDTPKAEEKPSDQPKAETKSEAPQEEPRAEVPPAQSEPAAQPEAPKTIKVKVDGEEFDVAAEEVEAAGGEKAYRIQRASENRLKKAAEALAEANKTKTQMTDLVTALLKQKHEPEKPKETDEQFIASKMDIVRFGTPQESAQAWVEIQQRLQPKPVDANALIEQATNKWRHDQAVQSFDKKYQDIVTNPIRLKAVVALRQEALERHRRENPNRPVDWDSFYDTIGTQVRSAFGGQSQAPSAPAATSGTPSPTSEKEARKASIVNIPTAAAKAEAPKEDKPETREDILNGMRKARGLPVG